MVNRLTIFIVILCFNSLSAQNSLDCSKCADQLINPEQIKNLSIDELRFLTNDLFARRGYKFSNESIDFYYSEKNWYKPVSDNSKIVYSETEKRNIKTFQDRTAELLRDREKLTNELKAFQTAFLQNNRQILKSRFNFDSEDVNRKYLSEVLQKVNIDELKWFKKQGHYINIVDNLEETVGYTVTVSGSSINFIYDYDGGSEEVKDDFYPSPYNQEFTHFWEFEWKNGKLKFIRLNTAG